MHCHRVTNRPHAHRHMHKREQYPGYCESCLYVICDKYKNNYVVEFLYIADYTLLTFIANVLKEIHFIRESLF